MSEKGKQTSQPDSVTPSPCRLRDGGNDDTTITAWPLPLATVGGVLALVQSYLHFVFSFTITDML